MERLGIPRPPHIPDEYWNSITQEADRLARSLEAGDDAAALGDIKCLVEAVAKIALDVNGTPAGRQDNVEKTVKAAHGLLARQPGRELVYDSAFGSLATQASKMACEIGRIRNEYGGGHGRARPSETEDEMLQLVLDGGLTWARWAVRRIGYFAIGRPDQLIADLTVRSQTFRSGVLAERLRAARLAELEGGHQRAIGVAVGHRAARGTFVVRADGVDACARSDDLHAWPRAYRIGLVGGLVFDSEGGLTLNPTDVETCLDILDPLDDYGTELSELVTRLGEQRRPEYDREAARAAHDAVLRRRAHRRASEQQPLSSLAAFLEPGTY